MILNNTQLCLILILNLSIKNGLEIHRRLILMNPFLSLTNTSKTSRDNKTKSTSSVLINKTVTSSKSIPPKLKEISIPNVKK